MASEGSGVTIVDIARALGISKTAVSAALHGSGRVSEATRDRVLAEAAAMGYVSNRAAQRLRGGRNGAIGLGVPHDVRELSFYMELAFGAADAAAEAGSDLLLLADTVPGAARRPSMDGVIVVDPTPSAFPRLLERIGDVPVVTVGEYLGPERQRISAWIAADHRALVAEVLDGLAEAGATAPALVALPADREPAWAHDVAEGYRSWCAANDARPVLLRSVLDPDETELAETMRRAVASGSDGIVWVAQGLVLRALAAQSAGRSGRPGGAKRAGGVERDGGGAPGSRLVMATMAAEPGAPGVAGVDLRAREYGRSAVRLLLGVLDGRVARGTREVHDARVIRPA
ncbi:LacI family DNA-binding transcriptional regulator [Leucobacter sp. L43]|uniref:LacI family DNA-binding transcriptional regulator n=1 Tax=Leucobacter sp. L43 TaxID=2798040 RepID=UPI001906C2DA|nr:LacI family DNA-binding transcriptional regulator [Leucobacter sp. L43]